MSLIHSSRRLSIFHPMPKKKKGPTKKSCVCAERGVSRGPSSEWVPGDARSRSSLPPHTRPGWRQITCLLVKMTSTYSRFPSWTTR